MLLPNRHLDIISTSKVKDYTAIGKEYHNIRGKIEYSVCVSLVAFKNKKKSSF